MHYIIGIDDTDTLESRGTGHLARFLADGLGMDFNIHGVTRHQLLEDERVPKTAKNSCAAILFSGDPFPLHEIAAYARKVMLDDFQPGSDPGLCVASQVDGAIEDFGKLAQQQFVFQLQARKLAGLHQIHLEGLGGTQDGVIGALAAVGLASTGEDGRYVAFGDIRSLEGMQTIPAVIQSGIREIKTLDGRGVEEGLVLADKLRPARRAGQPILFVEPGETCWLPLKLD